MLSVEGRSSLVSLKAVTLILVESIEWYAPPDKHSSNERVLLLYSIIPMLESPGVQDIAVVSVVVIRQHKTMQA